MRFVALFAACFLLACSGSKGGPEDAAVAEVRLEGQIRRADEWLKVAPPVYHDAKMDLATRCRLMQDDAKAKGVEVPLCYDLVRKPARAITAIAVERDKTMAAAMQRLTVAREGTHFVIDQHGATYQLLDLAFVARHGDAYPEGEIRVVACNEAGEAALVAALKALYPGASVTVTDVKGAVP